MTDKSVSLINLDGLSEPLAKLVEAFRSGTGVLYEPTQIRRRAKAEVDAAIIKAEGDEKLKEMALRASERLSAKELRRQQNIESIVEKAAQFLPESVSSEKVDEDWTIQFFESCQDVGNEEMQSLWAKLLAGKITRPSSYSLRTLHIVKTMSRDDAELFTRFGSFVWQDKIELHLYSHLYTEETDFYLKEQGLMHSSFLHLESIGLINTASSSYIFDDDDKPIPLIYFGKDYAFTALAKLQPAFPPNKTQMAAYTLTEAGSQLVSICGAEPDEEYRVCLFQSLAGQGIIAAEAKKG